MSVVTTQQNPTTSFQPSTTVPVDEGNAEAALSKLLGAELQNATDSSMDRGPAEYSQSGLQTPYPALADSQSEGKQADHSTAAQYPPQQEVRSNPSSTYSTSATPTSEYGVGSASARSAHFPEYIQRPYHPASNHSGSSGGMAQSQSPSMSLQDGRSNHHNQQSKSDPDVPIDPSIATSSPAYTQHGQYSYPQQPDMSHGYPQHAAQQMYPQPRPDWAGYGQHPQHAMQNAYAVSGASSSSSAAPVGGRPGPHMSQVYSFVPIPGAQQHKRPRRRYEEIERMYKCGWNNCEKAYGTLNHLNAHVTMQSHGSKRTPEEFKEIRKEWKARKKEEENARKQEEERQRSAQAQSNPSEAQPAADAAQPAAGYQQGSRSQVQLPPIGYQPGAQVPNQYQAPAGGVPQLSEYSNNHMYSGYPASPYGNTNQLYSQHPGAQPKYESQH